MGSDPMSVVSALLEAGNVDTVYRDVYLDRARTLLSPTLSLEEFHSIEGERAELAELPLSIGRALGKGNWVQVKELSRRAETLKQAVAGKGKLLETARAVYAVSDVRLDPFSPGLGPFTRVTAKDLSAVRTQAGEQLSALEQVDLPWKDFYAGRRAALQTRVRVTSGPADATAAGIAIARDLETQGSPRSAAHRHRGGVARAWDPCAREGTRPRPASLPSRLHPFGCPSSARRKGRLGRRPLWTHFDGYLVKTDGRLQALAGGDARYGGVYDLVGVSRDYDSDRLVARFAVVQRERMVAW